MANEFIARKGLISSGSISVSGSVTASFFKGDGSQLTNLPSTTVLSSSVNIDTYTFTGDGSTINYALSQSYDVNSLLISVDGLSQTNINDFTLSGSTITFVETPPSQSNILVKAFVNVTQGVTGSFSGSFFGLISSASYALTASYVSGAASDWDSIANKPANLVSSSTQVVAFLPIGTVSSSAQYPGWVTASSQIDYNQIQNKLSGSVSTSAQIIPLLPNGTVSSSTQVIVQNTTGIGALATTGSNTFIGNQIISGSLTTTADTMIFNGSMAVSGSLTVTGSVNIISGGVTSSLFGTASWANNAISSSFALTASYVSGAASDWESVANKPTDLVSSSTQVIAFLPTNTVSSSVQIDITSTTNYSTFSSSLATVDQNQQSEINALITATGSYALQSQLQGVASTSAQVKEYLPDGTVSSSTQYPGWVTASGQIQLNAITGTTFSNAAFLFPQDLTLGGDLIVGGNDIRNNLGDDVITFRGTNNLDVRVTSGSLDVWNGEIRNGGTTAIQMNGQNVVISGRLNINGDEIRSSLNQIALTLSSNNISTPGSASATDGFVGSLTGSILSPGVVSSSAQYPGWVTSSTQIDWSSVNYNSGIVSSSGQVQTLLPIGTVSSSAQYPGWVTASSQIDITSTNGYSTFSSSIATKNDTQDISIDALNAATSSYALQTQLQGVPSSSSQVKEYLPDGTVSSSAQYPGWVTASSQVDITATTNYSTFSSSIATKNDSQDAAIAALSGVTGSYATTGSNSFDGIQTITNTTNSTNYTNGALVVQGGVGITKDVNISGSLTVEGLLTAVSMSTQYVTSSQYVVGTSRVIVNDDDLVRFAGLSVIDSGSTTGTGSLLWDSLKNHWIYEREDGGAYKSSVIIAGPKNYGNVGDEEELVVGRIPVATGGDHIDTNYASSSLRIDFNTKETHIEAGLYITGSVTSSVGFKGDGSQLTGIATTLAITGSDASVDSIDLKTSGLTFTGSNGITTSVANDTVTIVAPLGTVSSSGQVKVLLPDGTVSSSAQYPGWVTASSQIDITTTTGYSTFSSSLATVDQNQQSEIDTLIAATSSYAINSTIQSQLAGVVSSSSQVKPLLPDGTVTSSAQYPGWVTASSQIDYNLIQNKLSDVVSSSAQIAPLLPNGTVSSSTQYPGWVTASSQIDITQTTGYNTFSSSLATIDQNQQSQIDALIAGTSSYALQSQLAGVASSSSQVKEYLPDGIVSSSAQYPGWVTASSQIDYNSIQNKLSGVISSSDQFNLLSNTSASYALTASFALTAGSGGGGGGALSSSVVVEDYLFVGDGITTEYQVSKSYEDSSVFVTVGGLTYVIPEDYSISASTIVFTEPPLSASNISVKALMNVVQNATGSFSGSFTGDGKGLFNISAPVQVDTYTFDADGATTIFGLGKTYSSDAVIVSVDGLVYVSPGDYTVAGTTVTFVDPPTSESVISVKGFVNTSNATGSYSGSFVGDGSGLTGLPISVTKDTYQFVGNGITNNYSLSRLYDITSLEVSVAGLQYAPTTDYTLSGYTVSFLTPPPSGSNVYIRALINSTSEATGSFSGSFIGNFNIVTSSVTLALTATTAATASYVTASAGDSVKIGNVIYGGTNQQFGTASGFNFFTPVGSGSAYYLIINGKDTADGTSPSNSFMDVMIFQNETSPVYNVISSTTTKGSPGARTYSTNAGNIRIAVASGSNWYVDVAATKFGS